MPSVPGPDRLDPQVHFAARLADVAREFHEGRDLRATVDAVLHHTPELTGCSSAGLMLTGARRRPESSAGTDSLAEQAQNLQTELGEGPGFTALDLDEAIVEDSADEQRWPTWSGRVAQLGLRSAAAVRLTAGSATLGALTMYAPEPGRFGDDDIATAHVYAQHASVAIADATQESTLREAIEARHRIGQAQGIIMERYGLDADQAFALLRRHSQDTNIKLREVASRIVAERALPAESRAADG